MHLNNLRDYHKVVSINEIKITEAIKSETLNSSFSLLLVNEQ